MNIVSIVVLITALSFSSHSCCVVLAHVNLSGCTLSTHQRVGSLTAKNATLASVEAHGTADLETTSVSGHLEVTGKLTCKGCTPGTLTKTGHGVLYNTTIQHAFSSTNDTRANTCTFENYFGCGEADFEHIEVAKKISNTGNVKATDSRCQQLSVTGTVRAQQFSCSNMKITGKTTLTDVTVTQAAEIIGSTNVYSSAFTTLEIRGKTLLSNVMADTFEVAGHLDATNADGDTFAIKANNAVFRECSIKNLYVKKRQTPPVITIYNSPKTPERLIARIVCEDHATKIVYEKDSVRAQETLGTTHIT